MAKQKKTMTPDEFCKWLEGVLDATDGSLDEKQAAMVREKLENVQKVVEFKWVPQFPTYPQTQPWDDLTPKITWGTSGNKIEVKPDKYTIVC